MAKIEVKSLELNTENSAVILGSPGSGKTSALIELVRKLEDQGTEADEILVLTPSRLGASLLRDEIGRHSALAASRPRARSISAIAFEVLRVKNPEIKLLSGASQQALVSELVEGAIANKRHKVWGFDSASLRLQGFQAEVRDLLTVVVENRLDANQLAQMHGIYPKLKLDLLLDLLPEYQQRVAEQNVVDPSELLTRALEEIDDYSLPRFLLVDDAQDLSPAGFALVKKIGLNTTSYLFGDPDAAVLGFRAGGESFITAASQEAQRLSLKPAQFAPSTETLMTKITSRIPTSLATDHRPRKISEQSLVAQLFENQSAEADWLAARLRRAKLLEGLEWSQMAVVARTRNQLEQLASDLTARSVPVNILGVQRPLREQNAARNILDAGVLAFGLDFEVDKTELLMSNLAGLDAIGIRRLFRDLSKSAEFEGLSKRQIGQQLFQELVDLDTFEVRRLNRLTEKIKNISTLKDVSAFEFVSAFYELVSQESLVALSRGRSQVALAANRELDSLLELFAAAQRFDLREVGGAKGFIEHQLRLGIPEDSLAPVGLRPSVTLATSAQLPGLSFELVAIPRLQEGIWPNLKPRNSMLGASSLQSFLLGRTESPTLPAGNELADEIRLFYKAVGSHRSQLLLSAMLSDEEQPSQFFTMFGIPLEKSEVRVDFDIRRKVGQLRKAAINQDANAIASLAALALAGVPGAHPKNWQGLVKLSTLEPVIKPGEELRLSASRLQAFEKCPLHWFAGAFGADAKNFQASLGSLIHAALEASASGEDLYEFVASNWHTLEFESQWQAHSQRRKSAKMLAMVAQYLDSAAPLVAAEHPFTLQVGSLSIAGKIDRVEKDENGAWVVDLKTGRTPTQKEVLENRQLELYQLAITSSGEKVAGAKIVSVGSDALKVIEQPALDESRLANLEKLIARAAEEIGSDRFQANISSHCNQDGTCQLLLTRAVQGG